MYILYIWVPCNNDSFINWIWLRFLNLGFKINVENCSVVVQLVLTEAWSLVHGGALSAQQLIVYWSGSKMLVMVHVVITSSEAAVLTAWGKAGSWWGLQAFGTHRHSEQIQQELLAAQVTDSSASKISGPAVWRGSTDRGYRALQAHLIYIQYIDLAWLIMVQEHVLRVLLHITEKKILLHFINKQKANQSFTYDSWLWNRNACVCTLTSYCLNFY